MFDLSFQNNLADARFRVATESGDAPADTSGQDWQDWRDSIFGTNAHIDDSSTFRARKIVWYPAQDPASATVVVVVAESLNDAGIRTDTLTHSLTPAWLNFVLRLAELKHTRHEVEAAKNRAVTQG